MQICDTLKNLRLGKTGKKISKETMSEVCDVNPSTYMRWEKGETKIPFEAIEKLAEFYEIPITYFSNNNQSDNKLVTSIESLKSQLSALIGKEDPNEVVNTWNEQIYTRATLARMQELDAEIIKFPTARQADHLFVSMEEKKLWISSFWCFSDPWGTMRLLFFYSKYHASKHPENKGSNTFFFAEVPHWFQKQFPDHRQILNLDENTKPSQDKALA